MLPMLPRAVFLSDEFRIDTSDEEVAAATLRFSDVKSIDLSAVSV